MASSARVVSVLSNVPTRFTVPPLCVNVPKAVNVNNPPRFTVLLLALIVPALLQALDEEPDWSPRVNDAP